jgi:hypothetical protein
MKLTATVAVVLLSGCMSYGSVLDDIGKRPNPPVDMSNEQAAELSAETLRLRGQADAIRVRLASEADRRQRFRYYEQLRRIGDDLRPLEAQLRDAGRLA